MNRKYTTERIRTASTLFVFCNLFLIILRRAVKTSLIIDQLLIVAGATALLFGLNRLILTWGVRTKLREERVKIRGLVWVVVCSLSAFILFGLAGPAAIERSKSAHVVKWVGESNEGINTVSLYENLVDKYGSYDIESVKLRLEEQVSRRLFSRSGENYSLTLIGRAVYETADFISLVYSLPGWEGASLMNRDGQFHGNEDGFSVVNFSSLLAPSE